jgi:hypothetical protein
METYSQFENFLRKFNEEMPRSDEMLIVIVENMDILASYDVREYFLPSKKPNEEAKKEELEHEKHGRKWYVSHNPEIFRKIMIYFFDSVIGFGRKESEKWYKLCYPKGSVWDKHEEKTV